MPIEDKNIASARKEARRMARSTDLPYQSCLDVVAKRAGHAHWGELLASAATRADPVTGSIDDAPVKPMDLTMMPERDFHYGQPENGPEAIRQTKGGRIRKGLRTIMTRAGIIRTDPLRRSIERRYLTMTENEQRGGVVGSSPNGRPIHLMERTPILVLSPPGTGKTAGTVIPHIVTADRDSLVIHDDGDLMETTSGYRRTLGPVHVIRLDGGPSVGSLNPLDEDWLPRDTGLRASYLDNLAQALSPEDRNVASILLDAMRQVVEFDTDPDLVKVAERIRAISRITGDIMAGSAWSCIEAVLDPGIASACTGTGQLKPSQLHGIHGGSDHRGWNVCKPVTIYIVRDAIGGMRQGRIAAMLQAAIWSHLLVRKPNAENADGTRNGILPVTVIVEGCTSLPAMPMLGTMLDRGRRVRVGHMIVAHDANGARRLFHADHAGSMESLFAIRIVHPQVDVRSAQTIASRFRDVSAADMLQMPKGRHVIAVQNLDEPIWARTRFFFENAELRARTYNPRMGTGPKPM